MIVPKLKVQYPDLPIVDLREGITLRPMEAHDHGHDHAHAHEDATDAMDPHIWLDPVQSMEQVRSIADSLKELDPENAAAYDANAGAFIAQLQQTHEQIESLLAAHQGKTLYVFHPAYGYFTERYGMQQRAIEIEGKEPSLGQLDEIVAEMRDAKVDALVVQPQFSKRLAQAVAAQVGAEVIELDPLSRNLLPNYLDMARKIDAALTESTP
jgi:zinc transport system substrate-binding protein